MTRIALVTGGNRGLGLATARRLAQQGIKTLIAARDAEAGRLAAAELAEQGLDVEDVQLDVTSQVSVQRAADTVASRHGRLDVLVNNAGVLPEATNSEASEVLDREMFRRTFTTNVIGAVGVLEAFLPTLRKSEAGRVVNVSTTMGSLSDQLNPESPYYQMVVPAYQSSKAALNGVTIALSKLLADTPIKVTSVCPGFVQTDLTPINKEQAPLTPEQASEVVVRAATLPDDAPSGTFVDQSGTVAW